jgi:hypothetical protein
MPLGTITPAHACPVLQLPPIASIWWWCLLMQTGLEVCAPVHYHRVPRHRMPDTRPTAPLDLSMFNNLDSPPGQALMVPPVATPPVAADPRLAPQPEHERWGSGVLDRLRFRSRNIHRDGFVGRDRAREDCDQGSPFGRHRDRRPLRLSLRLAGHNAHYVKQGSRSKMSEFIATMY